MTNRLWLSASPVITSPVIPSTRNSCSRSSDRFWNGNTAMDGRSFTIGGGNRATAVAPASPFPFPSRCRPASNSRTPCRNGDMVTPAITTSAASPDSKGSWPVTQPKNERTPSKFSVLRRPAGKVRGASRSRQ